MASLPGPLMFSAPHYIVSLERCWMNHCLSVFPVPCRADSWMGKLRIEFSSWIWLICNNEIFFNQEIWMLHTWSARSFSLVFHTVSLLICSSGWIGYPVLIYVHHVCLSCPNSCASCMSLPFFLHFFSQDIFPWEKTWQAPVTCSQLKSYGILFGT